VQILSFDFSSFQQTDYCLQFLRGEDKKVEIFLSQNFFDIVVVKFRLLKGKSFLKT
jgi:hypothetical protein